MKERYRKKTFRKWAGTLSFILLASCSTPNGDDTGSGGGDLTSECTICHGSHINPAPPRDTSGNVETEDRGVGAHQSHLALLRLTENVDCNDCHIVPTQTIDPGHIDDDLPAEVIFSERAQLGGLTATWNGETCSQVYCHGASLSGGSSTEPVWTLVDGTQTACGSCHGFPPPSPHPDDGNCSTCHGDVVNESFAIIDTTLHINGVVDFDISSLVCNTCHGNALSDAPPVDLQGNVEFSFPGVGAHLPHLFSGNLADGVRCNECHIVPVSGNEPGHIDGTPGAEVIFSGRALLKDADPIYTKVTCVDTYCHNPTKNDLAPTIVKPPVWTTQFSEDHDTFCGSCHGFPPLGIGGCNDPAKDVHREDDKNCVDCHSTSCDPSGNNCEEIGSTGVVDGEVEIVRPWLHVNGVVEVTCWDASCHCRE